MRAENILEKQCLQFHDERERGTTEYIHNITNPSAINTRYTIIFYKIIQYMSDFKQSYAIHQEVQTSLGMRSSYPGFDSVCSG